MHHIVKRGFCLLALVLLTAGHAAMAEDLRSSARTRPLSPHFPRARALPLRGR